jgi:hypothetical protein
MQPPTAGAAGYALDCDVARGPAAWAESCLAFASPNESPSKTEVDLVVSPLDPMHVVVASKDNDPKASKCVWAIAQVSKDGGKSWQTSYLGGEAAARQPTQPLWGWNCITDPIMAFDAEGMLYYSIQAYDHTFEAADLPSPPAPLPGASALGSAIFAARSRDGGITWDKIVPLHVGDGANVFHDYMRVLVNPATGTYHTIWNQFTGVATVVPVLVSWDGASERGDAPVYFPVAERPDGTTMAGFAAATDGTMYVLLTDGADAWSASSTDDGRTWGAPVLVESLHRTRIPRQAFGDDAFRTTGSYELIVDNTGGERDGWLYATISDCSSEASGCDVYVSHSEDGGATWIERMLVNGGEHLMGYQWMPRPSIDRLGNLHVLYFDNARTLTNLLDATWAVSTDGGVTFANTRLTQSPFDGNLGIHQDGFPFIGDYNGIGTSGDWLYMGFPTTVTGRAEIAVAKVRLPSA